ncbi:hypothetical protein scyTo_0000840 [Scyliorhinus torazame]|uniref:Uncharacterized protein n=1 Tax=Scyliorhinus torazame TaxID=75743 RepID=A0A401P4Y2_SCYTO|nr:hypothetical protein [Scyliorhinus torazame]
MSTACRHSLSRRITGPWFTLSTRTFNDMMRRLQRILLKLRRYDCDLVYTPGKELIIADTLSRSITVPSEPLNVIRQIESQVESQVQLCASTLPASDEKVICVREGTAKDTLLQHVM